MCSAMFADVFICPRGVRNSSQQTKNALTENHLPWIARVTWTDEYLNKRILFHVVPFSWFVLPLTISWVYHFPNSASVSRAGDSFLRF